jgi:hypothetical protein
MIVVLLRQLVSRYYTITDFCRSEYEFLLNCKIILAEGRGKYIILGLINPDIHRIESH